MGSAPDPYGSNYGVPPNPYGGQSYGHPGMMGGPHMHGGSGYGNMGNMGGSTGRSGIVPFRAGDWKCGNEGCNYHNFAKNVHCLRCGASRSNAAIVAEGGMTSFPGNSYGGGPPGPPQSMTMGSMDNSSYGSMTPGGNSYGGNNMSGGGYGGQSYGPPSTYALPSGIGAPSPYMAGGYSQMGSNNNNHGMQSQGGGGGGGGGGFDSRTEHAFNQGHSSSAGGSGYPNGAGGGAGAGGYGSSQYGGGSGAGGGNDGHQGDPFSFLSGGMSNLGLGGEREPRNGQNSAKSPQ